MGSNLMVISLPNRDELSLRTVFAFPNDSRIGFACVRRGGGRHVANIIAKKRADSINQLQRQDHAERLTSIKHQQHNTFIYYLRQKGFHYMSTIVRLGLYFVYRNRSLLHVRVSWLKNSETKKQPAT